MSDNERELFREISAKLSTADATVLNNIMARHETGWRDAESRLRRYECHHGYRLDQSCISANCDRANHGKRETRISVNKTA
jgi:hypothetical protein